MDCSIRRLPPAYKNPSTLDNLTKNFSSPTALPPFPSEVSHFRVVSPVSPFAACGSNFLAYQLSPKYTHKHLVVAQFYMLDGKLVGHGKDSN